MSDALAEDAAAALDGVLAHQGGPSIRDFLTDGSLTSLCAALSAMTGVDVHLRDEAGRRIVRGEQGTPWEVLEAEESGAVPAEADRVPLTLGGVRIGEIVVMPAETLSTPGTGRGHLLGVVRAVAATASEVVNDVVELRNRVKELDVLHRLSSLLATPTLTPESMLQASLDSALDVLGMDAGSIVLLPEDADGVIAGDLEQDVELKASRNLSRAWLDSPLPLSRGREFDRIVLTGSVLAVEDLLADRRVFHPQRCLAEGLRSFLSTAMLSGERPIGVIRLYAREPRRVSMPERQLLKSIGEQAAAAVQQARLVRVKKQERRIQRQLRLAGDVQSRMLPRRLPRVAGVDIAARSLPSAELAGDFYDVFALEEGSTRLGVVIGDVVGKGVAAGLMMSLVRASLRAYAQDSDNPAEVLTRTNKAMCRDTLDNEFATVWYGVLDTVSGELTYCSAGHEPPMVLRVPKDRPVDDTDVRPLGLGGLVLGVDPNQTYPLFRHRLEPGDVLFAYTDGLTDARNFNDEKFGWSRLVRAVLDALREDRAASAQHIVDQLMWALRRFAGLREQVDDETLVIIRWNPSA